MGPGIIWSNAMKIEKRMAEKVTGKTEGFWEWLLGAGGRNLGGNG